MPENNDGAKVCAETHGDNCNDGSAGCINNEINNGAEGDGACWGLHAHGLCSFTGISGAHISGIGGAGAGNLDVSAAGTFKSFSLLTWIFGASALIFW
ncbi:unnamed protein product [Prunus armeniaca]